MDSVLSNNQVGPGSLPQPKTTSVVSSNPAVAQATGPIQSTLTDYETQVVKKAYEDQQTANLDATATPDMQFLPGSKKPNPNYKVPPPTQTSTPGDQATTDAQNAVAHPGQTQYYNQTTGQAEWLPTSATPPAGFSSQDPKTRTDVLDSIDAPGGITIKKFSDGTYGRFNLSTGEYSQVSSADFQAAQDLASTTTDLTNLRNGILSAAQQKQVDNITAQYQALIKQQQTANANFTGGTTVAENMYGLGNTDIARGEIKKSVDDGTQKIADLQTKMNKAVDDLKSGFLNDDVSLVKQAYQEFDDSNTGIQKNLDTIASNIQKAQAKIDAANLSVATSMAKKYSDTDEPILPNDSPDVVKQKLQTSPRWQQDQQIATSLNKEETDFVGQMGLAGANLSSILPSLGLGKAATETKVQILKGIVDNAKKLGVSPEEVAQSIIDKQAAGKTYGKLLTQGSLLSAAETKTEADFQNVKNLGKKLTPQELQTGIPLLQGWIRTGTLATSANPNLRNYLANLTTTLTNYGRVVAGQTGAAGITAAANSEAQGLIDKGLSVEAVNSFIDQSAIPDMKNTILGYTTALNAMDKAINTANGTVNPTNDILGSVAGSTPAPGTGSTNSGSSSADSGWAGF